jgi:hypothetical protein
MLRAQDYSGAQNRITSTKFVTTSKIGCASTYADESKFHGRSPLAEWLHLTTIAEVIQGDFAHAAPAGQDAFAGRKAPITHLNTSRYRDIE